MNSEEIPSAEQIYRREIDSLDKEKSLSGRFAKFDRNAIVEYFLGDVLEIAKKYENDVSKDDFMDLVGAGNEALILYVNSKEQLTPTTARLNVRKVVEDGIKNYVLREIVDKANIEYDRDKTLAHEINPIKQLDVKIDKDILGGIEHVIDFAFVILNQREKLAIQMRYGLGAYERQHNNSEIAEVLGLSRERVRQIIVRGEHKLTKPTASRLLKKYLEAIVETEAESRAPPLLEEITNLKTGLKEAREIIESKLGMRLDKFRIHYELSRNDFVDYISSIYQPLGRVKALKLIHITDEEKKKLQKESMEQLVSYKDIESMKRTINRLKKIGEQVDDTLKIDMFEQLREIYTPIFASDKKKCLDILANESISQKNPEELRGLFKRIQDYFNKVDKLKIEGISTELDDFQKVDLEILSRRRENIIASEMGTGKSLEAIAYAVGKDLNRVLVVSTKSGAYSTWPRELRRHLEDTPSIAFLDGQRFRNKELLEEASKADWFVTTYTTAARYIDQLRKMNFDFVVLDECHKVNNEATTQSSALTSLDAPNRMAISGFLFKNNRTELFPILNWLFPADFPSREEFVKVYCKDEAGLARLQYELRHRIIVRFKDDVLKLPRIEHFYEYVAMNKKQNEEYRKMEDDFVSWYENNVSQIHGTFLNRTVLTKLHGLRNKVIEPKIPVIKEVLHESLDEGRKVVLYTTYISAAESFRKRFANLGVCYVDGRTKNEDRAREIDEFETNPKKKVFIITAAGGESIDLSVASHFIYANKPLTYADAKQALDRVHRRGQTRKVKAFHITTSDTIDERIEKLIGKKQEEYERVVHDSVSFMNWFEENESKNIKELLEEIVSKSKGIV